MVLKNKIWKILPLILFGGWYAYKLYRSFEEEIPLDGFVFLFIGAAGLSCLSWIIHLDLDEYKETKSIISFLPSFAGLLIMAGITGMYYNQYHRVNAATLLKAFFDEDYTGITIDLKKNGNYILSKGSMGRQLYAYGHYTIDDSLITLESDSKILPTDRLVIRTITDIAQQNNLPGLDTSTIEYIFLKNKDGEIMNKHFYFRVIEDNRKK